MLIGEFLSPLGDKNRIALPKKLRDQIEEEVVITRGYERCLLMVDQRRWEHLINEINRNSLLSLSVRDTKRFLLGGAYEIELDAQGRFVIPEALMKYAKISTEISFVGVGEWIEIWDATRWQEKLNYLSDNASDLAEKLGDKHD